MSALITSQPLGPASSRFFTFCAKLLQPSSRRHQSSYRRNRSRLNIKPDASFLPTRTEIHDHVIFNPPPSMPNVYHTPSIFLPKNDPRKQLRISNTQSSRETSLNSNGHRLPPAVRETRQKRYHLTEKDLDEMRNLRRSNPAQWSASKLAKRFDCSPLFVSMATDGIAKEQQKQQKLITDVVKSRWGTKRRIAREDRMIRRERWYRDD